MTRHMITLFALGDLPRVHSRVVADDTCDGIVIRITHALYPGVTVPSDC